jgi:hypothetical protein
MNRIIPLLLVFSFVISCNKDEFQLKITYPSTYYRSEVSKTGEFRLFSSQGEIKSTQIIQRFKDMDEPQFGYSEESIRNNHYFMDTIYFKDTKNVLLYHQYQLHSCTYSTQGERLILLSTDTVVSGSVGEVVTKTLEYQMGQVKPEVYSEYIQSSTRGFYIFGFTGREKFVLKETGGQLTAPLLLYSIHSAQSTRLGFMNNELQNDFYKWLAGSDTVAIQGYQVLLEK